MFPAAAPQPQPQGGSETQPLQILRQMIQLANAYIQAEPDPEDQATMAKLLQTLHTYLAKDQQDRTKALGGNASAQRLLRKAG